MAKTSVLDSIPTEAPKKGKAVIPTISVKGGIIQRYTGAIDQIKAGEAIKAECAPILQERGLAFVFAHNCEHPDDTISSVNIVSQTDAGADVSTVERVQFTWAKRDLKNDPKTVQSTFDSLTTVDGKPVKWQDYLTWEVAAKFDAKVFNTKGKFDEAKYKKFAEALQGVCDEYGVPSPLSLTKSLVPKDDFHERRFRDFDLETNQLLLGVLPNTMSLEAVRPVAVE